jgi:hypothetical protein
MKLLSADRTRMSFSNVLFTVAQTGSYELIAVPCCWQAGPCLSLCPKHSSVRPSLWASSELRALHVCPYACSSSPTCASVPAPVPAHVLTDSTGGVWGDSGDNCGSHVAKLWASGAAQRCSLSGHRTCPVWSWIWRVRQTTAGAGIVNQNRPRPSSTFLRTVFICLHLSFDRVS